MQQITFPNEATPVGSTSYYVCRFSQASDRDVLSAIFLFRLEMQKLQSLSDPGVARIKLQWWHQQIKLPVETPSSHPLASCISLLLQQPQAVVALDQYIQHIDELLHRQPVKDFDAFVHQLQLRANLLQTLFNSCSKIKKQSHDLHKATWIEFIECIHLLGRDLRDNVCLLPHDKLAQFSLTSTQLLQPEKEQMVKALLKKLSTDFTVLIPPTAEKVAKDSPLDKYYKIRKKHFDLLARENYPVVHEKTSLTPIKKFWFAWK